MKTEGLSFPEAVEKLAREVGLPVPRATPAERERAERVATLQQVVEEAARWFQKQLRLPVGRAGPRLPARPRPRRSDHRRFPPGLRARHARRAAGGAQARGRADRQDRRGGARHPARGQTASAYDRFRGRVMFPINDRRGRVDRLRRARHGRGRAEIPQLARDAAVPQGRATSTASTAPGSAATKDQPVIVAEGYMDVIALHGAGFAGAVAPLGTALTEGQLGELWKLADEPYLCFDGDNAGRRAAAARRRTRAAAAARRQEPALPGAAGRARIPTA